MKAYWCLATSSHTGTCILLSNNLIYKTNKFEFHFDGRLVCLDVTIHNQPFRLLNIYAPADDFDRKTFLLSIDRYLVTSLPVIFGGDFNCVLQPHIDKIGGSVDKLAIGAKELRSLVQDFYLKDCFRQIYPNTISTSWRRGNLASRIDRFYISKYLHTYIRNVTTIPCSISDHDYVCLTLQLPDSPHIGRGSWKFNNSLLSDTQFCSEFIIFWQKLTIGKILTLELWDQFKIEIKTFVQKYCRIKSINNRKIVTDLETHYRNLSHAESLHPGQYAGQIQACKEQLLSLQINSVKGAMIRSKTFYLENQEKPSRYFFKKESQRGSDKVINKITHSDISYTKTEDILSLFKQFYSELYSQEPVDESLFSEFTGSLPRLSDDEKLICEGHVTYEECFSALKMMKNDKSPGSDGLTKEFYVQFFPIIGNIYITIINHSYELGLLSSSQRTGHITLICKDKDHADNMKNWRPISLLNLDYKILTKTLTNRLRQVMANLISIHQTCAVPERSILDNNHLLRSVIDYVNQKELPCGILSLDQEKAFDRVNHKFLFNCLEQYGFGPHFISWIKLLYTDIHSSVIVNKYISSTFSVTRSVRQGCSLSPLLYVLILEPFLRKLSTDSNIIGLHVPGNSAELKYTAFADDVNAFFYQYQFYSLYFRIM